MNTHSEEAKLTQYGLEAQAKGPDAQAAIARDLPRLNSVAPSRVRQLVHQCTEIVNTRKSGGAQIASNWPLLAAILYAILPLDAIPDLLPVIGWVDDIAVLVWAIKSSANESVASVSRAMPSSLQPIESAAELEGLPSVCRLSASVTKVESAEIGKVCARLASLRDASLAAKSYQPATDASAAQAEAMSLPTIAVLGRYNTGKSSILNALFGQAILPTGSVPTTNCPVFIRNDPDEKLFVQWVDGSVVALASVEALAQITHEVPKAALLMRPIDWLSSRVLIVDTPGIADGSSVPGIAYDAVLHADALIVVLEAEQPLSADEQTLLQSVQAARPTRSLWIVLNRIDAKSSDELTSVKRFVQDRLKEKGIRFESLLATSARDRTGDWSQLQELMKGEITKAATREHVRHSGQVADGIIDAAQLDSSDRSARVTALARLDSTAREAAQTATAVETTRVNAKLIVRINGARSQVLAGLDVLLKTCADDVERTIRASTLHALQTGIQFDATIRERVDRYLHGAMQKALTDLTSGMEGDFAAARESLHAQGFDPVLLPRPTLMQSSPSFVLGGAVIVSWFMLGFFSFVATVIVAAFAKEGLLSMVSSAAGYAQRGKLEEAHRSALRSGLQRIGEQMSGEVTRRFTELEGAVTAMQR